jgi:predicted transcriptional regulator
MVNSADQQNQDNAEQFLNSFNRIEQYLGSVNDSSNHVGFKRLVDKLSQTHSLVGLYKQDLIEFNELRNAIVHRSTGEMIAQPSDQALHKIQELEQKLTNPPRALDIASKPIYAVQSDEYISTLVRTMNEKHFSYVPIYEGSTFKGVFSEHTLTRWLASIATDQGFTITEQHVNQVYDFLDSQDDKYNAYRFVDKDKDAFSIREDFIQYMSKNKRLSAVFVTDSGSPQQDILGIITAWDIHKLGEYVASRLYTPPATIQENNQEQE